MSDRIDFYEVRAGDFDDWDSVCLCKDEDSAKRIIAALDRQELALRENSQDATRYFIEHVEIVARVDLEMGDY